MVRLRIDALVDLKVRVGVRRDLRQVRDAQHLKRRAERLELAADDVGDPAADAGVDFVEDQAGRASAGGRALRALPASGPLRRAPKVSVLMASMIRDSSPPETMRASGRRSSPGLGETKNSATSIPSAVHDGLRR